MPTAELTAPLMASLTALVAAPEVVVVTAAALSTETPKAEEAEDVEPREELTPVVSWAEVLPGGTMIVA